MATRGPVYPTCHPKWLGLIVVINLASIWSVAPLIFVTATSLATPFGMSQNHTCPSSLSTLSSVYSPSWFERYTHPGPCDVARRPLVRRRLRWGETLGRASAAQRAASSWSTAYRTQPRQRALFTQHDLICQYEFLMCAVQHWSCVYNRQTIKWDIGLPPTVVHLGPKDMTRKSLHFNSKFSNVVTNAITLPLRLCVRLPWGWI